MAGFLGDGVEDAVALAAGGLEIAGLQRESVAELSSLGGAQGSPGPPGAVVVPEVVVRVFFGSTCDKCECVFLHDMERRRHRKALRDVESTKRE